MRESLRLGTPASFREVAPFEDTTLGGGKYAVKKDTTILCALYTTHRDPKVWGEDVCALPLHTLSSLTD